MPLYEIAVMSIPSKKELEEGEVEKLLYYTNPPICAKNEQGAIFQLAMVPALKDIDMNKATLMIRPFA